MAKDEMTGRVSLTEAEAEASRARREALHVAADHLNEGVTALESDPDLARFVATLREVLRTVQQHVDEVEAANGLFEDMTTVAPHVTPRVDKLRREHVELLEQTRGLLGQAEQGDAPATLATEGRALADRLTAHRHRGTALMLDVFLIDIPAAD